MGLFSMLTTTPRLAGAAAVDSKAGHVAHGDGHGGMLDRRRRAVVETAAPEGRSRCAHGEANAACHPPLSQQQQHQQHQQQPQAPAAKARPAATAVKSPDGKQNKKAAVSEKKGRAGSSELKSSPAATATHDAFGFRRDMSPKTLRRVQRRAMVSRTHWDLLVSQGALDTKVDDDGRVIVPHKVRDTVRVHGISHTYRRVLWARWCNLEERYKHLPSYARLHAAAPVVESKVLKQIDLDLLRTFPEHNEFEAQGHGFTALRRMLVAFSALNPHIGYVQSMNFIGAFLLLVFNNEETAFWAMHHFLTFMMRGYYEVNLPQFQHDEVVFDAMFHTVLPDLYNNLNNQGFSVGMVLARWFLCGYLVNLSADEACRVWDVMMMEQENAPRVLMQVALALLRLNQPKLSKSRDAVEMLMIMQNIGNIVQDVNDLTVLAFESHEIGWLNDTSMQSLRDQVTAPVIPTPEHVTSSTCLVATHSPATPGKLRSPGLRSPAAVAALTSPQQLKAVAAAAAGLKSPAAMLSPALMANGTPASAGSPLQSPLLGHLSPQPGASARRRSLVRQGGTFVSPTMKPCGPIGSPLAELVTTPTSTPGTTGMRDSPLGVLNYGLFHTSLDKTRRALRHADGKLFDDEDWAPGNRVAGLTTTAAAAVLPADDVEGSGWTLPAFQLPGEAALQHPLESPIFDTTGSILLLDEQEGGDASRENCGAMSDAYADLPARRNWLELDDSTIAGAASGATADGAHSKTPEGKVAVELTILSPRTGSKNLQRAGQFDFAGTPLTPRRLILQPSNA